LFRTFNIYCSFVTKNLLGKLGTMFLKYVTNTYMVFLLSTSTVSKDVLQLNSLDRLPFSMFQCRNNTFIFHTGNHQHKDGQVRVGEGKRQKSHERTNRKPSYKDSATALQLTTGS